MTTQTPDIMKEFPSDSFQRLFWEQQYEAVKQKNPCTMHWHLLMIKGVCIFDTSKLYSNVCVILVIDQSKTMLLSNCVLIRITRMHFYIELQSI